MDNSRQIAGLIGPTLIVFALSETLNLHIWATNMAPVIYLNGALLFVAGLSIVRAHNRWTLRWPVWVTLTGWVTILLGLYRMFLPEARQAGESVASYVMFLGVCVIGIFLTFKAYRRGL